MKNLLTIFVIGMILWTCTPEPQLAQVTEASMQEAFVDYTTIIDIPIPDKVYKIYVNEDSDWYLEYNDSLYWASTFFTVIPAEHPYVATINTMTGKFRYITDIVINGNSKIDIKNFIDYYEEHRIYTK